MEWITIKSDVKGEFRVKRENIDGFNSFLCEAPPGKCYSKDKYHNVILWCGMEIPVSVEEAKRISILMGVDYNWIREERKVEKGVN